MRSFKTFSKKLLVGLFCSGLFFSAATITSAAAENKAAQITMSFPKNLSEDDIHSNGSFHVTLPFNGDTTINKNTTLSAEIYIPAEALKKSGSLVIIEPALEITGNSWHTIGAKYDFLIRNKKGKVTVSIRSEGGSEKKASSSIASIKKKGKYYKLSIKKCPLKSYYILWKGEVSTKKKVKKETSFITQVYFVRCNRKFTKKYFYWDNLKIKTGSTKTVTFDKDDYGEAFGHNYITDKTMTVKITKIK